MLSPFLHFYEMHNDYEPCLFGRYGGDKFYLYYEAQLSHFMTQFYTHLTTELLISQDFHVDISITLGAMYGRHLAQSFNDWVKQADDVLYDTKNKDAVNSRFVNVYAHKKGVPLFMRYPFFSYDNVSCTVSDC